MRSPAWVSYSKANDLYRVRFSMANGDRRAQDFGIDDFVRAQNLAHAWRQLPKEERTRETMQRLLERKEGTNGTLPSKV